MSNNTGNASVDLVITGTGQNLTWYGIDSNTSLASSNWGINAPTNWVLFGTATPARYQEYTSGGNTEGDSVTFDDTLGNDTINPQATNVVLNTTLRPFPVTINNTLPYSFTGSGGLAGVGSLIKTNSGGLSLLTSNAYSGGTFLQGGTVTITNDSALGASSGSVAFSGTTPALQINGNLTNSRVLSVTANSTIGVGSGSTARFNGVVSGAAGLDKSDLGTLALGSSNLITGALRVSQGTLSTFGVNIMPTAVLVGDTAGQSGTLNVSGSAFLATNNGGQFTSGLIAGSVAGASGDIRVTAGTLAVLNQFGLGAGAGGYGAFTMTGGALNMGSFVVVGFATDSAVYNQSSGSCLISNNLMTIAAGASTSIGVANFSGGSYTATNGTTGNNTTRGGIFAGEFGTGTLNVSGTASLLLGGQANLRMGVNAGAVGTVNLLGGTVNTPLVTRGGGAGTLNFNGGTLKATAASASYISGLSGAYVYAGGATIDDGGFGLTIPQPLLAPAGYIVSNITLSATGSGYIDTPIVTIAGGTGSNATATAQVNLALGTVTNIVVTSPGTGYGSSDTLSVTISGGGGTGASANTPVLFPAVSGGFTKLGAGTVTLAGANTYTNTTTVNAGTLNLSGTSTNGPAAVNAGTLVLSSTSQLNGNVTVSNKATFGVSQIGTSSATVSNLTMGVTPGTNGATLSLAFAGNTANALLNCNALTLTGTNIIALAGHFSVGVVPLVHYVTIAGTGSITNLTVPQGVVASISNGVAASTLYAVITSTGPGLVWTGTNSTAAFTNQWNISTTTNWTLSGAGTTYQETTPPGDAVTFDDTGSSTVIVSNTVDPFSILISDSAKNYTFQGPGHVGGSTGITKAGTGTVFMNLTNNAYLGDTVVSNGTFVIGNGAAVPNAGNLVVAPLGTFELAGISQTINGLSGAGIIDNNSTTVSPTVTVGGGGASSTWSGSTIDNPGTAGTSLTKIGAGTLVIAGTNHFDSATASQINAGTLVVTNNGFVSMAASEFWTAQGAGSTATTIVDGGNLLVQNFLVVGRAAANANGTFIVNHGTVQKTGANVIVIGSLGGIGTFIVNGGQVLDNNEFWLGENATAVAQLYLNGGLLQVADIRPNGATPTTSIAYFNGGTLQPSGNSANFLQSQSEVMSNGLVLDDAGFTINISSVALLAGDAFGGGLVKKGSGTVYLDTGNQYTGTTVVTNGTLAGIGSVSGPVVVGAAGNIGGGNASGLGTFSIIGQPLTLHGTATMRINYNTAVPTSDLISGMSTVNYGGTLVVSNTTSDATPLTTSSAFTLFSVPGSGAFSSIVGSPGAGLAYAFNPANGMLTVVSNSVATNPTNISYSLNGNSLTLTWPGDHLGWILQGQTNGLNIGVSNNWQDVPGSGSSTQAVINVSGSNPTVFFRLRSP